MTHPAARPNTDLSDHRVTVVFQSVATVLAALMLVTCGGSDSTPTTPPPPPTPRVTTVVVTPSSATLVTAGETVQLTASALDQNGATMTGQSFTWSSSDDGVATVSSSGLATAVGPNGSVTISATTAGVSGTASVDVVASPAGGTLTAENGDVTLTIPQGSLSAPVTITVEPFPSVPADAGLVAGSVFDFGPEGTTFDPPAILTLAYDEAALPVGLDEQSLTLLTERTDGSWEEPESSAVTVDAAANTVTGSITGFSGKGLGIQVAAVQLTPTALALNVGESAEVESTLRDALGAVLSGRWVRWTSSDKTIVEVRPSSTLSGVGEVTAVAAGQAVVTAQSGGVSATVSVTVTTAILTLETASLPESALGVAYSETLTATGGSGNYTWSLAAGSLPAGLGLNTSTGEISGTPTGSGRTFTVQVASGDGQTAQQVLSIAVSGVLEYRFSDFWPTLTPAAFGLKTYEWTVGESGQFTSEIIGEETVPYQTGAITGATVRFGSFGTFLVRIDQGLLWNLGADEGEGTYYVSTDCALTEYPPDKIRGAFVDGMILDESGEFFLVKDDLSDCILVDPDDPGVDSGTLLLQIRDVNIGGRTYNNALVMWELEKRLPFQPLQFHGKELEIGITLPTAVETNGWAIDDITIFGFGEGIIAIGDVLLANGNLEAFAELVPEPGMSEKSPEHSYPQWMEATAVILLASFGLF